MEEIIIEVNIPDNVTIVAGPVPGREAYRLCKGSIDIEERNILRFPPHVKQIIGSFFTGFFEELSKSMTTGEIAEHFGFDSQMQSYESAVDSFSRYISNN